MEAFSELNALLENGSRSADTGEKVLRCLKVSSLFDDLVEKISTGDETVDAEVLLNDTDLQLSKD